jgi:hypothetical protein
MKNDIIYEYLSNEQIDALEIYDADRKADVLSLIDDFHNAGMTMSTAIKLAFDALREDN